MEKSAAQQAIEDKEVRFWGVTPRTRDELQATADRYVVYLRSLPEAQFETVRWRAEGILPALHAVANNPGAVPEHLHPFLAPRTIVHDGGEEQVQIPINWLREAWLDRALKLTRDETQARGIRW